MKGNIRKISDICKIIFGYGIMFSLFLGGMTMLGYIGALIIGGDTAALICTILYKRIIPIIIYLSTVMVLLGLVTMYLAGEKALTPSNKKKG